MLFASLQIDNDAFPFMDIEKILFADLFRMGMPCRGQERFLSA